MSTSETPPPPDRSREATEAAWERRVAQAEINGRSVNEAIARGADTSTPTSFVCECGRIGCTVKLTLDHRDYDRARESFVSFVVAPGHEIPEVDDVVERYDDFLLVRKQGEAAQMAEQDAEAT